MPLNKLFVSKHHFLEYFMHLSHRWPWYNRKRLHNEVPKYLRSGFKAHFIIANPNPPKGEPQDDHHEGFSSRRLNRRICLTTSFSGSDFAEGEMFGKVSKIALKKKQYGSIHQTWTDCVYMFFYCQVEQQCIVYIGIKGTPCSIPKGATL